MIDLVGVETSGGFVVSALVDVPAGVQEGDLMVMLATANDHPGVTWPDGWTLARTTVVDGPTTTWVLYRHATDDEPSVYEVVWEDSHWHFVAILAWRGAAGIRATASATGTGIDQLALPSLDARVGDVLVAFGYHWSETSKNWSPAGLTTVANLPRGIIASYETTTAGPTPAYTLIAGTTGHMAATAILLEPPAGPSFPPNVTVELQVDGSWVDITGDVRVSDDITISRGRRDEASQTDPGRMSLVLNNRHGRYSPRNPQSPYYGRIGRNTPIRVRVGTAVRGVWEVSAWPTRWDTSGADVWVPIDASGLLRRAEQGARPLDSALVRYIVEQGPLAYWPLTNPPSAGLAGPPLVGTRPFRFYLRVQTGGVYLTRPAWQDGDLADHLEPVVRVAGTRGLATGGVPAGSGTSWSVDWVRTGIGGQDSMQVVTAGGGSRVTWYVGEDPTVDPREIYVSVMVEPDDGSPSITILDDTAPAETLFDDNPHHMRLSATPSGSDTAWTLYLDGTVLLSGTTSSADGQPKPVTNVAYEWWVPSDDEDHLALGHVTVWGADAPTAADVTEAMLGFPGETAGRRIQRIATEEGLALEVSGDLDDTELVGVQGMDTPLALVQEAAAVDGGLLGEDRTSVALAYRTRTSMYNQTPALTLNYANGEVAPPLEPVDDDQEVVNDVTVKRAGGGEYRATLDEGPLSVQAPPDGVGRYDTSITVNVADDDQLAGLAGWLLHLGTVDEARYPVVRVNLGNPRARELVTDVVRVDVGDRIQVTGLPAWMPPGGADLIVQGYTERINTHRWEFEFVCTPAAPWTVAELPADDDLVGPTDPVRADTAGSELAAPVDAAATVLSVATTQGPPWTTDPDEFPFDVAVGGEVMRVVAITGTSSPQTFTVQRSINGVQKGHATGTDVRLAHPAIVAL